MLKFEGHLPPPDPEKDIDIQLAKYPGLRESLLSWCDPLGTESGPLSPEVILQYLTQDEEVREAARDYLSSGAAHDRDPERAESAREALAWALVRQLAKQSGN